MKTLINTLNKSLVILLTTTFIIHQDVAAQCGNMDFETGDFTGWVGSTGCVPAAKDNPNCNSPLCIGGKNCNIAGDCCPIPGFVTGRHEIITASMGNDTCGNFPMTAPSLAGLPAGNFSARLGNRFKAGQADMLSSTFTVDANSSSFTYQFAVVLQDPDHKFEEQPFFEAIMFDQYGDTIPCSWYYVTAAGNIPGFEDPGHSGGKCKKAIHKPWSIRSVDLSAYIGQDVTIRFKTGDCGQGGHFGYAYIDASCQPLKITQQGMCLGGNGSATLTAPPGFSDYQWTGPGGFTASGQVINITQPGTYDVTMDNDGACKKTLSTTVTVTPGPTSDFAYSSGCSLDVPFSDNSSISTGSVDSWTWHFGDGTSSNVQNPTHTYPSTGTYDVTLVVASNGCTDSIQKTVTIGGASVATFAANNVCLNNPTNFIDSSYSTSGNITNWSWNFGDGTTSTQQHPTHTYTTPGTYNVSLGITTSDGCNDTIVKTVSVHAGPVPSFSANDVCLTNPTIFNDGTTASNGTISTWDWDFGDGSGSTAPNPTHTYSTPGTYNVTLVVTTAGGCIDSIQKTINVTPFPVAAFTAPHICLGNATPFTNTSTAAGDTITTYSWDFGDGNSSSDAAPSHTYGDTGTYNVTLTVTTKNGCQHTFNAPVSVSPAAYPSFNATEVCLNNPTDFNDLSTVASGGNIVNWDWDFGEPNTNNTSTTQNPSHTYSSAGSFDVNLTITTSKGCQANYRLPVIVNPLPTAAFETQNVCLGDPAIFNDTSFVNGGSITEWVWNFGDSASGANNISKQQHPTHVYDQPGSYTIILTVTTDKGCQSTVSVPIQVEEIPVAALSGPDVCLNELSSFIDASTSSSGRIGSWLWDFGDGNTSVVQNPSHTYTSPGIYKVSLLVANGLCEDTASTYVEVYPIPNADFTLQPNVVSVLDPKVTIKDISTGGDIGGWNLGDGDTLIYSEGQSFDHTYYAENVKGGMEYMVTLNIINEYGCPDVIQKPLRIEPYWTFFIPDAFTPNTDGTNETFFGKGEGILEYEMWIFDRWGNQLFHCDIDDLPQNPLCHWDGVKQYGTSGEISQQDVYVWKVVLTDIFEDKHQYIGHVSLIK